MARQSVKLDLPKGDGPESLLRMCVTIQSFVQANTACTGAKGMNQDLPIFASLHAAKRWHTVSVLDDPMLCVFTQLPYLDVTMDARNSLTKSKHFQELWKTFRFTPFLPHHFQNVLLRRSCGKRWDKQQVVANAHIAISLCTSLIVG